MYTLPYDGWRIIRDALSVASAHQLEAIERLKRWEQDSPGLAEAAQTLIGIETQKLEEYTRIRKLLT